HKVLVNPIPLQFPYLFVAHFAPPGKPSGGGVLRRVHGRLFRLRVLGAHPVLARSVLGGVPESEPNCVHGHSPPCYKAYYTGNYVENYLVAHVYSSSTGVDNCFRSSATVPFLGGAPVSHSFLATRGDPGSSI